MIKAGSQPLYDPQDTHHCGLAQPQQRTIQKTHRSCGVWTKSKLVNYKLIRYKACQIVNM